MGTTRSSRVVLVGSTMLLMAVMVVSEVSGHDYGDALSKSILFFEGQRSGKLPSSQRLTWRKDSSLHDGAEIGVDLVGGYYDAGDNVKFNFPMAWSTTMLAWSVSEFRKQMGQDLPRALDAIRWATDYFLKATIEPGLVYAQVGEPYSDHYCWERPEDMDTPQTTYSVSTESPGSEVSAEIAAALAAASLVFRSVNRGYSDQLISRAKTVFEFADKRCAHSTVITAVMRYASDELIWAASWLFMATKAPDYWNYVVANMDNLQYNKFKTINSLPNGGSSFAEFRWDSKHAGINVLASKIVIEDSNYTNLFMLNADRFVCSVLPESPTKYVKYSPGGLLFKEGASYLRHGTALSFLLIVYASYLNRANRDIQCGDVKATPGRLIQVARGQQPESDQLTGAVVGGPDIEDRYNDSRAHFVHSEPTTYINAPLVGVLAFFKGRTET
ncbi:hypothetical protein NL676_016330 [Syzygium grande]|nr:hypothetical protein NL676_016330 [Syzygium grande]